VLQAQEARQAQPGARLQRAGYGEEDAAALEPALIQNSSAREDTEKECRVIMQTGLIGLLREKSRAVQGQEPPTDSELEETITGYTKLRLQKAPVQFEFADENSRPTKGENRPEGLMDKVEDALVGKVKAAKGWHLFGLSIMDAQRSVLLAVDNRNPVARRIYWMDRARGGFDDVTGRLDERITRLTQELWSAQPPDRRHRTRATFWTFAVA
jgi:hypothetical protein